MYKWKYKHLEYSKEELVEHCPTLLPDIFQALHRIIHAINHDELIFVIGDYDSDGFNACNIFHRCIREIGGNIQVYIPERHEKYGANERQIQIAHQQGAKLIITVDNGSTAFLAIERAKQLKIDMIILDHHNITDEDRVKNNVLAFVNPKRSDSQYPFSDICATMITYKISQLLYDYYGFEKDYIKKYLDFVAIATVGDVMPLIGENRRIVIDGIQKINEEPAIHVRILTNSMQIRDQVDVKTLGWMYAPALNAPSRLGQAKDSYSFLHANGTVAIKQEATNVVKQNNKRKELKTEAIEGMSIEKTDFPIIYYHADHLHHGLVGIIAGEITKKFKKPALVSCLHDGAILGSGRSFNDFDLYSYILSFPDMFFFGRGGHKEAVGFEINPQYHQQFKDYLYQTNPVLDEYILYWHQYLTDVEQSLEMLKEGEPYGHGYEKPLFLCEEFKVEYKKFYSNTNKVYGSGWFGGKKYSFCADMDQACSGDTIKGIVDLTFAQNGDVRLAFVDYEVTHKKQ